MAQGDRDKFRTLLNYYIEHNNEHAQELKELADKVRSFAEKEVSDNLIQAAQEMDKASQILTRALKRLEGGKS